MGLQESGVSLRVDNLSGFVRDIATADNAYKTFASGSGKSIDVGNPFTALPGQAGAAITEVQAKFSNTGAFVAGIFAGVGAEIGKALLSAVEGAITAIPSLINDSISQAASFEQSFKDAFAILQLDADKQKAVVDLSLELGANPDLSVGLEEVNQAAGALAIKGIAIEDITGGVLKNTILLQNALGGSFDSAGTLVAKGVKQFGIGADQVDEAVNSVVGTVREGGLTSIQDYNLALSSVGGVAAGLKIPFGDMNTAIAATAKYFSSGSDAGTGLKSFLLALTPTTKEATKAMQQLGIDAYDSSGNLRPLSEVAQQLNNALEGTITTTVMSGGATEEQKKQIKNLSGTYASITGQIFKYENGISGVGLSEEKRAKKIGELKTALDNTAKALDTVTGSTAASTAITKEWQATQEQRIKALKVIFGSDAIRTALGLGDLGAEGFAAVEALIESTDAAAIAAEKTDTLTGRWKAFGDAVGAAQVKFGAPFLEPLKSVLETSTTLFNLLVAPSFIGFGQKLADGITPAIGKFNTLGLLIENFATGLSNSISLSDLFDTGPFDASLVRDVFGGTKIKLSFGDVFTFVKGGDGTTVKIKDLFTLDTTGDKFLINVKDFIKFTNSEGKTTFNIGDFFSFENNRKEDRTIVDLGKLINFTNSRGTTFFNIGDYFSFRKDVKKTNVDLGKLIKFTNSKGQSRFNIGDFFTFDRNVNKTTVDLGKLITFTNSRGRTSFNIGDFFSFNDDAEKTTVDLGGLISFTNSKGTTHFNIGDFFTFDSDTDKTEVDLANLISFTNSKGRTSFNIGDFFSFNKTADKTTVDLSSLISFTNSRGKTTFNIGDFFSFNKTAEKTTVDIGSLISFTNSEGKTTFKIGDFFSFDSSSVEKVKVDPAKFIEFTKAAAAKAIFNIGDFFSFKNAEKVKVDIGSLITFTNSRGRTSFNIGDFFSFNKTAEKTTVDIGSLITFTNSKGKTTFRIGDFFSFNKTAEKTTVDIGSLITFTNSEGKTTFKIGDFFSFDSSSVEKVKVDPAKFIEFTKDAASKTILNISDYFTFDSSSVKEVKFDLGDFVSVGGSISPSGIFTLTINESNLTVDLTGVTSFITGIPGKISEAITSAFSDPVGTVLELPNFVEGVNKQIQGAFAGFGLDVNLQAIAAGFDAVTIASGFLVAAASGIVGETALAAGALALLWDAAILFNTIDVSKFSAIGQGISDSTTKILNFGTILVDSIKPEQLSGYFSELISGFTTRSAEIISGLDAQSIVDSFSGFITSAVGKLAQVLSDPLLGQSITDGVNTLIRAITGNEGLVQLGTGAVTLGLGLAAISTAVAAFPVAALLGIASTFTAVGSVITFINTLDLTTLEGLGTDISDAATSILDFGTSLVDAFDAEAFATTASDFVTGFVDRISATISGVDTGSISTSALTFVTSILNKLSSVFGDSSLGADIGASAGKLVGTLVQKLTDVLSNPQAFGDLGKGVGGIALAIGSFVTSLVTSFATEISKIDFGALASSGAISFTAFVQGVGTEIGNALDSAIENNLPGALDAFNSFINGILEAINQLPGVGSLITTDAEAKAAKNQASAAVVTGTNAGSPGTFTKPVTIQEAASDIQTRVQSQVDAANLSIEELAAQQAAAGEQSKSFTDTVLGAMIGAGNAFANLAITIAGNNTRSLPTQGPQQVVPLGVVQAPNLGAAFDPIISALTGSAQSQPVVVTQPSGEPQVTFDPLAAATSSLSDSASKLAGAFPSAGAQGQPAIVTQPSGEPQVTFDPLVSATASLSQSASKLAGAFPSAGATGQASPTRQAQPVGGGSGFLSPSFTSPIPVTITGGAQATPSAGGSSLFGAAQAQQKQTDTKVQNVKLPTIKLPSFAPLASAINSFSSKLTSSLPKLPSFTPLSGAISFAANRLRDIQSPPTFGVLSGAINSAAGKLNSIIIVNLNPLSSAASSATSKLSSIQTVNFSGLLNAVNNATSKLGSIQPVNFTNLLSAAGNAAARLGQIQSVNFGALNSAVGRATGVLNGITGTVSFAALQAAAGKVTGIFNGVPAFPGWPNCPCPPVTCANANASEVNEASYQAMQSSITLSSSIVSAARIAQKTIVSAMEGYSPISGYNGSEKVMTMLATPPQVTNNYYNNRYYQLTVNTIDSTASVLQQFGFMEHMAAAL